MTFPARPRPADVILTVAVLAACAFWLAARPSGQGARALVYRSGQLVRTADLSRRADFTVDGSIVEVREGRIRIARADCPHRDCEHGGWISRAHQRLVCAPKRLVIAIDGGRPACDATTR